MLLGAGVIFFSFKVHFFGNAFYSIFGLCGVGLIMFLYGASRSIFQGKVILDEYGLYYIAYILSENLAFKSAFIPFNFVEETLVYKDIYLIIKSKVGNKIYIPVIGVSHEQRKITVQATYYLEDKLNDHRKYSSN